MKKIFITLLFIILITPIINTNELNQSQSRVSYDNRIEEVFILTVTNETNGVIALREEHDNFMFVGIELPNFYNFELFSSVIRSIVRKYEDLEIAYPWYRNEENDEEIVLYIDNTYIYMTYMRNVNYAIIGYEVIKNKN